MMPLRLTTVVLVVLLAMIDSTPGGRSFVTSVEADDANITEDSLICRLSISIPIKNRFCAFRCRKLGKGGGQCDDHSRCICSGEGNPVIEHDDNADTTVSTATQGQAEGTSESTNEDKTDATESTTQGSPSIAYDDSNADTSEPTTKGKTEDTSESPTNASPLIEHDDSNADTSESATDGTDSTAESSVATENIESTSSASANGDNSDEIFTISFAVPDPGATTPADS